MLLWTLGAGYGPPTPHHQQQPPPMGAHAGRQPQAELQQQPEDESLQPLPGAEPQRLSQDAARDASDVSRIASQSTTQPPLDVTAPPQSEQEGQQ